MSATLYGIPVRTSTALGGDPYWRAHGDWRERLARNFGRPSTGKWESLAAYIVPPDVLMIGGDWVMSPRALAAIKNLGNGVHALSERRASE